MLAMTAAWRMSAATKLWAHAGQHVCLTSWHNPLASTSASSFHGWAECPLMCLSVGTRAATRCWKASSVRAAVSTLLRKETADWNAPAMRRLS